jgi:epoxyqueuosine reductase
MSLIAAAIQDRALSLGFDLFGIAPLTSAPDIARYQAWLDAGMHADMGYLARPEAVAKRADPSLIVPHARHAILLGVSYDTISPPEQVLKDPSRGRIARYAWGLDYHDVITPVLRDFGEWIAAASRAYVDTGPVLERAWAQRAGLGFIGKNTCLIHRQRGSFFFLGAIFVDAAIEGVAAQQVEEPPHAGCGACTRCLTACPTRAFPRPGVLDARHCISYWTIEAKACAPEALRPLFGNWLFGCDICQDVCPYVRQFSQPGNAQLTRALAAHAPDLERIAPKLSTILSLTPEKFKQLFSKSALMRAKWRGLLRNACVAAGNSGDAELLPLLRPLTDSTESELRQVSDWAIRKISDTV